MDHSAAYQTYPMRDARHHFWQSLALMLAGIGVLVMFGAALGNGFAGLKGPGTGLNNLSRGVASSGNTRNSLPVNLGDLPTQARAPQATTNASFQAPATQLETPLPPSLSNSLAPAAVAPTPTVPPTVPPAPTPIVTARITPSPVPTPTATAVSAGPTPDRGAAPIGRQQVADAEAALRAGQLEATIDYGNGSRSSVQMRFDLGDAQRLPRLHIISTNQGIAGTQTIEQVVIGEQTWQHGPVGSWTAVSTQDGLWDQLHTSLPQIRNATDPGTVNVGNVTVLRWYDTGREADVELQVDAVTGIPQQLHLSVRATGLVLTVIYRGWNTAVQISPPSST